MNDSVHGVIHGSYFIPGTVMHPWVYDVYVKHVFS